MKKIILALIAMATLSMPVDAQKKQGIGIKMENMDTSVNPAEDFYRYACGGWMKNNPLPAAYSRFGSFDQLALDNNKRINDILTELQKGKYQFGTLEQKIKDLYELAMDSTRRNAEGVAPVMPYINELNACKTMEDLQAFQLKYAPFAYGSLYSTYIGADDKDAKNNILNINQGGLTLGQKEYYLENDEAMVQIRKAYKDYVVKMFQQFGFTEAEATAKMEILYRIETTLAIVMKSRTELRDVEKNYNKFTLKEFQTKYPNLMLEPMLNAEGIDSKYFQELVVGQPDYLAAADKILASMTVEDLRTYMLWDLISSSTSALSDEVAAVNFDFFGKTMSGRQEDYPRWKKATSMVESVLGQALGKMYCERYFPAASKERMKTLVANLQKSLGERILAQEWMSETTKAAAIEKLSTFYVKIGYPDEWKDMSKLTIDPKKSLYENLMAARLFRNKQHIEETVGKPVNRDEWHMTPQTVNAYYNPTTNEICFPAGILQYPFFDAKADDAFNYGAIGVVIGHEMTHGFDDQGAHYDKDGNMSDWWSKEDVENFNKLGDQYAEFYNNIELLPGVNCNGRMTLGENLADHGGLQVAYNAYKAATANKPLKTVNGLTPDQRFFLAYAGVWGQNITEKETLNRLKNDVHSTGEWRVNGALPHINAWYEAFGVKKGDKLFVPESERLNLW